MASPLQRAVRDRSLHRAGNAVNARCGIRGNRLRHHATSLRRRH